MDSDNEDFDFDSIVEETRQYSAPEGKGKGKGKGKSKQEEKIVEKELKKLSSKPDPEEIAKREELLLSLCRYGNSKRLGAYLSSLEFSFDPKKLRQMTSDDLSEMLTRVETALSHKNQNSYIGTGIKITTGFIERVTSQHPVLSRTFNCAGLTMALEQNEDYLDALEELDIKYGTKFKVGPETRVALAYAGSTATVVAANRQIAAATQAAEAQTQQSAPAPAPAASEGMGLGGLPPKEEGKETPPLSPEAQKLKDMGFSQ